MSLTKYKKLLWLIPIVILLIAVPFINRTQAYLTDNEKQTNQVEFSNVRVEIQEPNFKEDKIVLAQSMTFTKDISVKNTGTAPCFVRVYLDFSDSAVRSYSTLSQDGENYYAFDDYPSALSSDWVKGTDGYFYYTKKLEVGNGADAQTSLLLESVKTEFPSGTEPYAYDIIVYSEAVQVVGSDGTVYDNYEDAFSKFNQ